MDPDPRVPRPIGRRPLTWPGLAGGMSLVPFAVVTYRWLWVLVTLAVAVFWISHVVRRRSARQVLSRHALLLVGTPVLCVLRGFWDWPVWTMLLAVGAVAMAGSWLVRRWPRPLRMGATAAVGLVVGVASWWACRLQQPAPPPDLAPGAVVVCLGDSLTSGLSGNQRRWPEMLAEATGWRAINAGVAGDRLADVLARVDRDALSHTPALTIVLAGGNDILDRSPPSRAAFEAMLEAIVARLRAAGSRVALVEVPGGAVVWDRYGAIYARVAGRHGCRLVPEAVLRNLFVSSTLFDRFRDTPLTRPDGIHLTPAGQRRLADGIRRALHPPR